MRVPAQPPNLAELTQGLAHDPARLRELFARQNHPVDAEGRYLHWDELRHKKPPDGLSPKEHWLCTKLARRISRREVPVWDPTGKRFDFSMVDPILERLHHLDSQARGNIGVEDEIRSSATRDRYLASSLMEEAITSSQLEGAATTRKVAKAMLAAGRKPKNIDERMIVNNFRAMQWARENLNRECSAHSIQELHRIVSRETLDHNDDEGRFRRAGEPVYVRDQYGNTLYQAPDGSEVEDRIEALCQFANDTQPKRGQFIHPMIRAILLHFGLAYIHPFVDGNGRTARALFYWSMLSQGYWLLQFLSISRLLKRAPAQYARAFLYSETDDNDLNYFILHQLDVLERGVEALKQYVQKTVQSRRLAQKSLRHLDLNPRQVALLRHAMRHPEEEYTIQSHRNYHGVVYQTARTDLLGLEELELLERFKRGKAFVWRVSDGIDERIESMR